MKLFLRVLICCCLLAAFAHADAAAQYSVAEYGLNGRVKSLVEYNYTAFDIGNLQNNSIYKIMSRFDEQGKKIRQVTWTPDGLISSRTNYSYDEDGLLTAERNYDGDGHYTSADLYSYDRKGREVLRKQYAPDGNIYMKTSSEYDGRGNLIVEESYDAYKDLAGRAKWRYDTSGNPIMEAVFNADDTLTRKTTYEYDGRGNMVAMNNTIFGLTSRTVYTYNDKDQKTEERHYNAEKIPDTRITYKYDDQGNETEQNYYSADNKLQRTITYRNEYDRYGNLVRKVQIGNGRQITILRKEIAYY
jgi:YD repeat-containing protein